MKNSNNIVNPNKEIHELTAEDFYNFYSNISEDKWCKGSFSNEFGECCALGHLGEGYKNPNYSKDGVKLTDRLYEVMSPFSPVMVNDGDYVEFMDDTPKKRILAALKTKF